MGKHDRRNSQKMRRLKAQTKKKAREHKAAAAAQAEAKTYATPKKKLDAPVGRPFAPTRVRLMPSLQAPPGPCLSRRIPR